MVYKNSKFRDPLGNDPVQGSVQSSHKVKMICQKISESFLILRLPLRPMGVLFDKTILICSAVYCFSV